MAATPQTIDEHLAHVSDNQRAALEKLRRTIRSAAPKAEEVIRCGLPSFRLDGKQLVAFGAARKHCAFYPLSSHTAIDFATELAGYDTSRGTIRFQPDKPLPSALVRKLVKARIKQNASKT